MERDRHRRCLVTILFFTLVSLGAVSFVSCIAAEINRSEVGDMKMDGKSCYLPQSEAFKYGIVALVCSAGAQVIGGAVVCGSFCPSKSASRILSTIKILLVVLSWISFGGIAVLLGTATSMNREQPYGEGWLNGECYLVRRLAYVASAVLILFSAAATLLAAILTASGVQSERKQHRIRRSGRGPGEGMSREGAINSPE